MPKVGSSNEALYERAMFVYTGSLWVPLKADSSGQLAVGMIAGQSIEVTQATPADLNATVDIAANQSVDARLHGYITGQWKKAPIPFGPSSVKAEKVLNSNLAAGANTLSSTGVPAGKLEVITNIGFYYIGTVAGVVLSVNLTNNSILYSLFGQTPPVSALVYDRQGQWVLSQGDNITLAIAGATLHDAAGLIITGYVMDINV